MSTEAEAVLEFEQYHQAFKDKGLYLCVGDWDLLNRTTGSVFWICFSQAHQLRGDPHMTFLTLEEVKAFYRGILCKEILINTIKG